MSAIDSSVFSKFVEPVDTKREERKRAESEEQERVRQNSSAEPEQFVKPTEAAPKPTVQTSDAEDILLEKLELFGVDSIVLHKKFGRGVVVKMDKNAKYIHIKFILGEKKFLFPDAFLMGFLEVW